MGRVTWAPIAQEGEAGDEVAPNQNAGKDPSFSQDKSIFDNAPCDGDGYDVDTFGQGSKKG